MSGHRILIAPSLLSVDFGKMAEGLRRVEEGGADLHHVDVMDGHFVPNLSIGPPVVAAVAKAARIPLDCHLMVTDPLTYGKRFAEMGAWGVTFHIEVSKDPAETAKALRAMGLRPAVAINPPTAVEALEPALEHVDMILVMSVNPGFGGQKFIPDVLAKVEALRRRYGYSKDIEMDGGIASDTIAACAAAGANVFVAGTAIYGTKNPVAAIADLRAKADHAAAGVDEMGWPFRKKREMPEGLWQTCPACKKYLYKKQVEEAFDCCPECGEHFGVNADRRIALTADEGTFEEIGADIAGKDILGFVDAKGPYAAKLLKSRKDTGHLDACVAGRCRIQGVRTVVASLDFKFQGGSMGHAVGEKVAVAIETALADELPCVVFSASGGARMHEGAMSLMQMSKTSAAVHRFKERGRTPFISVLTNPTTGGVTASYAALGDVIVAEPKALIGFAGPRVIKQTIRQDLPEGFQTSEFLLERGFIDMIVPRAEMRDTLARLFSLLLPAGQ